MKITERISGFQKNVVRMDGISLQDGQNFIESYLQQLKWQILEEKHSNEKGGYIVAQNPENSSLRLFLNREPQLSVWHVCRDDDSVRVETSFKFKKSFRLWLFSILGTLSISTILFSLFTVFPLREVLLLFMASILIWIFLAEKYYAFRERYYSYLSGLTGKRVQVFSQGFAPPDSPLLMFFVFILISICISLIIEIQGVPYSPTLLLNIIAIMLVAALGSYVAAVWKHSLDDQLSGYTTNILLGGSLSIYSLIPVIFSPLLRYNSSLTEKGLNPVYLFAFLLLVILLASAFGIMALLYIPVVIRIAENKGKHTIHKGLDSAPRSRAFSIIALLFWIGFMLSNVIGVYFSLLSLEFCLFGKNYLFRNLFADSLVSITERLSARLVLGIYSLPLLTTASIFILKWSREIIDIKRLRNLNPPSKELLQKVNDICDYARMRSPVVVITKTPFITSNAVNAFVVRGILKISQKTLESLSDDEVEAILAHEIWHLKKHSLAFSLFDFLSEWTLFGKGFLAFIMNFSELEYKADAFALAYLAKKRMPPKALIDALNKVTIVNSLLRLGYLGPSNSLLSFTDASYPFAEDRMSLRARIRLLYEIYFGDLIISYIHPTIEDRIKRIETIV